MSRWLKYAWTFFVGAVTAVVVLVTLVICPPIDTSYANAWKTAGAVTGGVVVGNLIARGCGMPPPAPPVATVVVQRCGEGLVSFNGGCYTPDQCYKVDQVLSDQYGNYIRTVSHIECQE